MSTILCMVGPLKGLLKSSLVLCNRLATDGHDITIATPTDLGDMTAPGPLQIERLPSASDPLAEKIQAGKALVDRVAPDLVLIDLELHEQIIPVLARKTPLALLNTWLGLAGGEAPPLHTTLTPDRHLAIRAAWARHRFYKTRRAFVESWRDGEENWRSSLLGLARRENLVTTQTFDTSTWLYPFTYRNVPEFCLHAEELDFPGASGSQSRYIGPMIERGGTLDLRLSAFIETAPGPVIYGGFGSFFTADAQFLSRLFKAFESRPDWRLIMTRGGSSVGVATPPANIHLVDWAPQWSVLERCDAAVIHGGINTIDECIDTLTPMIVYSGEITDMPGNTARVAWHRLGGIGDRANDVPETIVARLEQVMADADIATALKRMRDSGRSYETERVAEREIKTLLSSPHRAH